MSNNAPLVSVIIPIYNCEPYLATALDSMLQQTYRNLEIIAVDDGSTDKSWEIITEFAKKDSRIKPFRNKENLKIVGTLNFAISQSHGKYIARMDGDDRREPDSIEKQVAFLEAHDDVVIVGGAIRVCDSELKPLNTRSYPTTDEAIRAKWFRYSPFAHPAIVMRASAVDQNIYQSNWAEDYDMYFRIAKKGTLANLDDVVLNLRTHRQSVSQSKLAYQEKLTLYLRLKAVFEYGYTMSTGDKWYFAIQYLTSLLMPARFRFWLFNKVRAVLK